MLAIALASALSMTTPGPLEFPDPHDPAVQHRGRRALSLEAIPRLPIGLVEGTESEGRDAVMLRAALVLDAFTAQHGVEGCGILGKAGDRLVIQLTTSGAAASCLMADEDVPEGFAPTEVTIHSHPRASRLDVTPVDRRIRALLYGGATKRLSMPMWAAAPHTFSATDRAAGPGFLVAGGALLELTADKQVRRVADLADYWQTQVAVRSQ